MFPHSSLKSLILYYTNYTMSSPIKIIALWSLNAPQFCLIAELNPVLVQYYSLCEYFFLYVVFIYICPVEDFCFTSEEISLHCKCEADDKKHMYGFLHMFGK